MVDQTTNEPHRYKTVKHEPLRKGDIVLIKEDLRKPAHYPLAIVENLNSLGESTHVTVRKGSNRELVHRHVSSIIPLLTNNSISEEVADNIIEAENYGPYSTTRPMRKAALKCSKALDELVAQGLM